MKILAKLHQKTRLKAFTLTEVVIATVIFSLAMAGVFASISNLRQPAVESSQEVTAAFIGKKILNDLRSEVSAPTWNTTGNLTLGPHGPLTAINVGGIDYTPTYIVEADPGTNARKVTLNISW